MKLLGISTALLRGVDNIFNDTMYHITPVISVVLPVYNGEKYIAEAIESILCQTFSDFELIVIDDGSTDETYRILSEYQVKDYRIVLISRENKGLIATLNEGVALAQGKWVARMDSDDIALPYRFERQLERLTATGADICGSWAQRFGALDKRVVRLQQTDETIRNEMLFCSPFVHPTVMMRTSLIQQLQYDPVWVAAEDYDLWERAIESGCQMTNVPEVLLLYRVHQEQVSMNSADFQQQQGQKIRQRYWMFVFNSMQLNKAWIDNALLIFISPSSELNMDIVDALFTQLLQKSDKESRVIILSHITRLYILTAADCPDIVSRWERLTREAGVESSYIIKIELLLFRLLRIRKDDLLFKLFKKLSFMGWIQ
jgi:glycosyltransferase involved in cell wall biosynthesis